MAQELTLRLPETLRSKRLHLQTCMLLKKHHNDKHKHMLNAFVRRSDSVQRMYRHLSSAGTLTQKQKVTPTAVACSYEHLSTCSAKGQRAMKLHGAPQIG